MLVLTSTYLLQMITTGGTMKVRTMRRCLRRMRSDAAQKSAIFEERVNGLILLSSRERLSRS